MNRTNFILVSLALMVVATVFAFQNCAKAGFKEPLEVGGNVVQQFCRNGVIETCGDATGSGVKCQEPRSGAPSTCFFESCRTGYQLVNMRCVPVACAGGAIANCAVANGEGRMVCNLNGQGYGACAASSCNTGFELQGAECVAVANSCIPGSHLDCGTSSTYANQTCNNEGSGYGACVSLGCKPGFYDDGNGQCLANVCDPNVISQCTEGAGTGFQTCNSQGSAWGACVLNDCQSGYSLKDGVCVARVCTPGETRACDFDNGAGEKTCNSDGLDYGACNLISCDAGYHIDQGQCLQTGCTPQAATTCRVEGGSGQKYCYQNGLGYGPCSIQMCDPGFDLKHGKCQASGTCEAGETLACTIKNGTGERACDSQTLTLGPCVVTSCDSGYEIKSEDGRPVCTPASRGKDK